MEIKRMRDLREDHDKTQQEIAELLNMHRSVYRRYENGKYPFGRSSSSHSIIGSAPTICSG